MSPKMTTKDSVLEQPHANTESPNDGATQPKASKFDVQFAPDEFVVQVDEQYREPELPFAEEFKPYANQWQFRWFSASAAIRQNGTKETQYFQVVRRGNFYKGVPFDDMFVPMAFDADGFISRGSRRDENTGEWRASDILCVRPSAAWLAQQKAIAEASLKRMREQPGQPLGDHAQNIERDSNGEPLLKVVSHHIKIEDHTPWE